MSATELSILGVVVFLTILIVVYYAYARKSKKGGDNFMPGDAAVPSIREAMGEISQDLQSITQSASRLNQIGDRIATSYGSVDMGGPMNTARAILAESRNQMSQIVANIGALSRTTNKMTPTYQNALSLYQGLRDSDTPLRASAMALGKAGELIRQNVASTDGHLTIMQPHREALRADLAAGATQLSLLSAGISSLGRSLHFLGNTLQLE